MNFRIVVNKDGFQVEWWNDKEEKVITVLGFATFDQAQQFVESIVVKFTMEAFDRKMRN